MPDQPELRIDPPAANADEEHCKDSVEEKVLRLNRLFQSVLSADFGVNEEEESATLDGIITGVKTIRPLLDIEE